jgi:hypothetical protein
MRHLLKFSYAPKDHKIVAHYSATVADGRVERITLESTEDPAPALVTALQAMAAYVCDLAEFPRGWIETLTVRGVTITRGEATGLTITALRRLRNLMTPLIINTPYTTEFGESCNASLLELERLVLAYVDGERAQMQLDLKVTIEGHPAA